MKFRSELSVKKMNPGIAHVNQLLLIGSCFTENIGALAYKHNPFNPNTKQHIAFRKKYAQLAADFTKNHPHINLQEEIRYFETGERASAPALLKEE